MDGIKRDWNASLSNGIELNADRSPALAGLSFTGKVKGGLWSRHNLFFTLANNLNGMSKMGNIESAAAELGGLRLPQDLEPLEVAGQGSRSITFRANYRGDILAMKVYKPDAIKQFKKKHNKNIAVSEMSRNRAFRKIPELLPFIAKPIAVMGHDGKSTLMFLQEFIDGVPLKELAERNKGLPDSVLEAGETIVRNAELNELYELDLSMDDVLVRKQAGVWTPVLHDFNHVPKVEKPSNSFFARAFKGSTEKKSKRDYQLLEQWRAYSQKCSQ